MLRSALIASIALVLLIPCLGVAETLPAPKPKALVRTITKDDLEKRIEMLRKELEQAKANLNAIDGAIQDCQYWLNEIARVGQPVDIKPAVSKDGK